MATTKARPRSKNQAPPPPAAAERSPRPGRSLYVEENPRPPKSSVDERDRVYLGYGFGHVDFVLTTGEHLHEVFEVGHLLCPDKREITVNDVVAYVLTFIHAQRDSSLQDFALWDGDGSAPRLVAVFRALPSGRRAVYFFDGPKVSRRVYPPHENWTKGTREVGR